MCGTSRNSLRSSDHLQSQIHFQESIVGSIYQLLIRKGGTKTGLVEPTQLGDFRDTKPD